MVRRVCPACEGCGKVMGLGCIRNECSLCRGRTWLDDELTDIAEGKVVSKPKSSKPDKRSASYKEGVKKLTDSGMSKVEAEKLIDEEFRKVA